MINPIPQDPIENSTEDSNSNVELVTLPSQGVYYSEPFKHLKALKVRKLDWSDEDILTTKAYYDNGTLFNEILKSCIVDENGFQAKSLVPVDRDTILWWLRINEFGKDYVVKKECTNPQCKHKFPVTYDLASYSMPQLPVQYREELLERGSIEITLPVSKLKCRITIPSEGRVQELKKRLETKKTKEKLSRDFAITHRLRTVILEVYDTEGNPIRETELVGAWLNTGYKGGKIPMVDSRYIQEKAKEISMDIPTGIDIVCPACENVMENVPVELQVTFFWPDFKG